MQKASTSSILEFAVLIHRGTQVEQMCIHSVKERLHMFSLNQSQRLSYANIFVFILFNNRHLNAMKRLHTQRMAS